MKTSVLERKGASAERFQEAEVLSKQVSKDGCRAPAG